MLKTITIATLIAIIVTLLLKVALLQNTVYAVETGICGDPDRADLKSYADWRDCIHSTKTYDSGAMAIYYAFGVDAWRNGSRNWRLIRCG